MGRRVIYNLPRIEEYTISVFLNRGYFTLIYFILLLFMIVLIEFLFYLNYCLTKVLYCIYMPNSYIYGMLSHNFLQKSPQFFFHYN